MKKLNQHKLVRGQYNLAHKVLNSQLLKDAEDVKFAFKFCLCLFEELKFLVWLTSATTAPLWVKFSDQPPFLVLVAKYGPRGYILSQKLRCVSSSRVFSSIFIAILLVILSCSKEFFSHTICYWKFLEVLHDVVKKNQNKTYKATKSGKQRKQRHRRERLFKVDVFLR